LEIRVGRIVKAWKHPNADSLFVEEIDLGETAPRQIVSGIFKFYKVEELEGSLVCVIANLLPSTIKEVMSAGMVLAASTPDKSQVELIRPPENSAIGERVGVRDQDFSVEVEKDINPKKKNSLWSKINPHLETNEERIACYKGEPLRTKSGVCVVKTLAKQHIS